MEDKIALAVMLYKLKYGVRTTNKTSAPYFKGADVSNFVLETRTFSSKKISCFLNSTKKQDKKEVLKKRSMPHKLLRTEQS